MSRPRPLLPIVALAAASMLAGPGRARANFLGPSPYLSFGESPFDAIPDFTYFHLETFEDGSLNTPGAAASAGWVVNTPGIFTDSVDADDGSTDGLGNDGHSYYSGNAQRSLTITFDAAALGGQLPTHVGIVWADVGNVDPGGTTGVGDVRFSAVGPGGSLGSLGPFTLGDGVATGTTPEDRFFGVTDPGGIQSISIAMDNSADWEVDHLQYGFRVVPEPASLTLLALGALAMAALHRFSNSREKT